MSPILAALADTTAIVLDDVIALGEVVIREVRRMSEARRVQQDELQRDINEFMKHIEQHDGPAEYCQQCISLKHQIRYDNRHLVETVADD